jgi:hypothetical protein
MPRNDEVLHALDRLYASALPLSKAFNRFAARAALG